MSLGEAPAVDALVGSPAAAVVQLERGGLVHRLLARRPDARNSAVTERIESERKTSIVSTGVVRELHFAVFHAFLIAHVLFTYKARQCLQRHFAERPRSAAPSMLRTS